MSEPNDMTCAELADVAAELALGVLTGRERAMAVVHLDKCDACREEVRQLMTTGEQLLELLPAAEPPAGFETRVLDRLGLPGQSRPDAHSRPASPRGNGGGPRRPGGDRVRPGAGQPGAPPGRSDGARQAGRLRRALAAVAVGVAVVAAGLGGWRIGIAASPSASPAAAPLTSVTLQSATHQEVGSIFLYSGTPRWLYMSVDLASGQELVRCQVVGTDGKATTIGAFRLDDGYGAWGSPAPSNVGTLVGARLVDTNGTVLATASFHDW